MRWVLVAGVVMLAGCTDPQLNAGIWFGTDGVSVYPSVSGRIGGLGVTVGP
jgi:hypothetical protein